MPSLRRSPGPSWPSLEGESERYGRYTSIIRTILEVVPGGVLRAFKQSYDDDVHCGFWLGVDSDGLAKLNFGGTVLGHAYYVKWTGLALQLAGDGGGLLNLQGGSIVAGSIVADKLSVRTLSIEQLQIGLASGNLVTDGGFESGDLAPHVADEDSAAWWGVVAGTAASGGYRLRFDNENIQTGTAYVTLNGAVDDPPKHHYVVVGRKYFFEVMVRRPASTVNTIRLYHSCARCGRLVRVNHVHHLRPERVHGRHLDPLHEREDGAGGRGLLCVPPGGGE